MGGPVYHYDAALDSPVKFPEAYDGDFFAGEFGRQLDQAHRAGRRRHRPVRSTTFPWTGTQVMDMAFGPDGALYVLDYGTGWFGGDENSALYRIENATDGHSPVAEAERRPRPRGQAPLKVKFSSAGTTDADGDALTYAWDFGDGGTSTAANPTYTYKKNGTYTATVTAKDPTGRTGSASVHVTVGNTAPKVDPRTPRRRPAVQLRRRGALQGEGHRPGGRRPIDCTKVKVTYILGHDSHGHPVTSANGCEGTIQTTADGEHDPNANIFGVFDAEYTDDGGGGQPALTTPRPERRSSPSTARPSTSTTPPASPSSTTTRAHGGKTVGDIDNGDWISFTPYILGNATKLTARVSSAGAGGTLEVRSRVAPTGTLLGTARSR